MISSIQLLVMLVIIFIAAGIFTNALEYAGHRMGISEGVTGSIFAAVGTALPETVVPILAILGGTADKAVNQEISVGAILGAPLMLSTLAIFLMAIAALFKRGFNKRLTPEKKGLIRDLDAFLLAFLLAAIAMFLPYHPIYARAAFAILLVFIYLFYLYLTFRSSRALVKAGHTVNPLDPLFLTRLRFKNNGKTITLQLTIGLILLLMGAKGFIHAVHAISHQFHFSPLLLSLLIIPIATELPEKINSITWIRKNKDTLAFGNLTGAMVFQGTLLPAIGIMLTPWEANRMVVTGVGITFLAAIWLRVIAIGQGMMINALMMNGVLYGIYLFLALHSA